MKEIFTFLLAFFIHFLPNIIFILLLILCFSLHCYKIYKDLEKEERSHI